MIAYKLFRELKDGSISPLFINKKARLKINEWLKSESHPTKGFAYRQGWHCTLQPIAPHLSTNGRSWYRVEIDDYKFYNRPESQGGTWVLADMMKILNKV